ncbi:MAG TPA: protein kinase [Kofleriaceae bacterium]|nr:protein kinase [Kofleriaceae bacterium]
MTDARASNPGCPPEHRLDAFLARTLAADERVELEAHFDHCDECRRLVFALASPDDERAPESREIGRYVITRPLGEGAMGVVFAARDPALQRDVAIKLLRGSLADHAEAALRLRREAQGLARLDHANVVAIYDVGTHRGEVYLAMELIRGTSLDRWLAARPRPWPVIVRVLLDAARGLAAAHDVGLVHRDIKPHNVMVMPDDRVKVVDFGLAHAFGASDGGAALADDLAVRVTRSGAFVGTPAYSAPEVLGGAPADRRSDVYSFCVMAFEALYGRPPFPGATVEQLRAAQAGALVLPAQPRLPLALRRMLERGLACDPDARPPTIRALLPALRRALWPRRRIAGAVLAAMTLVIGGSAVAAELAGAQPVAICDAAAVPPALAYDPAAIRASFARTTPDGAATADRVIARLERWRAEAGALAGTACRASRIEGTESAELFDLRMDCLARSTAKLTALVTQLPRPTPALVDDALDTIDRAADLETCRGRREGLASGATIEPARRPQANALAARLATVSAVAATGRHVEAIRDATAIAEEAARAGLRALEAEAWVVVGDAHASAQHAVDARAAMHRALVAAEAAGDSRRRVVAYLRLVTIDIDLEREQDAAQWAAQARGLADHLGDPSLDWQLAWVDAAIAVHTDPKRAVELLRGVIAQRARTTPTEDATTMELQRALGAALVSAGEITEGKRTLEAALAIGERVLGRSHPRLISTLTALGVVSGGFLNHADALPYLERAFAIAQASAGREHAQLPRTALVLGGVYGELMRVHDAIAVFDRTIAAYRASYGETTSSYAELLAARAEMLVLEAFEPGVDAAAAKSWFERALADKLAALAIQRKVLATDAPDLATSLERLGRVQRFAERPADAVRSFEEALAIRARDPKPRPGAQHEAELGLGGALVDAGRAREAVPHLEQALALAEQAGLFAAGTDVADAKAELAAALIALHRDRTRAIRLLRDARATYVQIDEPHDVAEVDGMLAKLGAK